MLTLSVVFLALLLITFAIVSFVIRETPAQKATRLRIVALAQPTSTLFAGGAPPSLYLTVEDPGPFGWLAELLADRPLLKKLKLLRLQSDSQVAVGTILASSLILALTALIAVEVFTSLTLASLPIALACGYLPFLGLRYLRQQRLTAFDTALPDCIEMCTRALRAGHSMSSAFGILADQAAEPARTEFGEVFKKQSYGLPLRDAMMQMLDRVPSTDLRVFVTGVLVQKDTGGNLADLLDRIAAVIRERIRIQRDIRTHTAQGRLTGWILCLLPIVMLAMLNLISPGYSAVLFTNPLGRKMLYIGFILLGIGGLIIRRIVNGIEV